MLTRKLTLGVVAVALMCSLASAAEFKELTPTYSIQVIIDKYAAEPGWEFRVADKVFSDWTVETSGSQDAYAPEAGDIFVTGGYWEGGSADGEIGLRFNSGWTAGQNQIADSTITFKITADAPFEIVDYTLYMDNFTAMNGGQVSISENLFPERPSPGVDPIEDINGDPDGGVVRDSFNNYTYVTDHHEFLAPMLEVWVSKDVVANGGLLEGGYAHLSRFYQTYSQIPEPATAMLLAAGGAALVFYRRRRK